MPTKTQKPRARQVAAPKLSAPANMRRVLDLMNRDEPGAQTLRAWVAELLSNPPLPPVSRRYLYAAREVEAGRGDDGDRRAYEQVQEILARLDAGATLAEIEAEAEAERNPQAEAYKRGLHDFARKAYTGALHFYAQHYDDPDALARFTRALESQGDKYERTAAALLALVNDPDTPDLVAAVIYALQYAASEFVSGETPPDEMPNVKTLARILRLADEQGVAYGILTLNEGKESDADACESRKELE